jgi:hypothetical protein
MASRIHKGKTMANPTKVIVDCSTGISETIELTDEEVAELAAQAAIAEQERAEHEAAEAAKATARTALLKKLGISAEEAALLLG